MPFLYIAVCICNLEVISLLMNSEIPPNNLYISVSRQNVCPKDTAIVMTLVSKTTFLKPLNRGGTFSNLMRYGDIPSAHGDIPVVSIQIYEVESAKQQKSVLSKFQPYGVYVRVLLVSGTQVSWLVHSFSSDSPSLRKSIFMGHLSIFDYLFLAASSLDSLFQSTLTSPIPFVRWSDWFLQETVDNVIDFNNTRSRIYQCFKTKCAYFWTKVR